MGSNDGFKVRNGHTPGVPGLNHRNTKENIRTSSSKPLSSDALNLVSSIAKWVNILVSGPKWPL